jgi:hypothetical protein
MNTPRPLTPSLVATIRAIDRMAEESGHPVIAWEAWVRAEIESHAHTGGCWLAHGARLTLPVGW